jgi:hypothetical protein
VRSQEPVLSVNKIISDPRAPTSGLSFRSKDPNFRTDPGVLPTPAQAKSDDIDIVNTGALHTDLSDRGPDSMKERIQATLDRFLSNSAADSMAAVNTTHR